MKRDDITLPEVMEQIWGPPKVEAITEQMGKIPLTADNLAKLLRGVRTYAIDCAIFADTDEIRCLLSDAIGACEGLVSKRAPERAEGDRYAV